MAREGGRRNVVHAGPFQIAIRDVETCGFDDVDAKAKAGGQPQDGAGIAGNVGLVKGDSDFGRGAGHGDLTAVAVLVRLSRAGKGRQAVCEKSLSGAITDRIFMRVTHWAATHSPVHHQACPNHRGTVDVGLLEPDLLHAGTGV